MEISSPTQSQSICSTLVKIKQPKQEQTSSKWTLTQSLNSKRRKKISIAWVAKTMDKIIHISKFFRNPQKKL